MGPAELIDQIMDERSVPAETGILQRRQNNASMAPLDLLAAVNVNLTNRAGINQTERIGRVRNFENESIDAAGNLAASMITPETYLAQPISPIVISTVVDPPNGIGSARQHPRSDEIRSPLTTNGIIHKTKKKRRLDRIHC